MYYYTLFYSGTKGDSQSVVSSSLPAMKRFCGWDDSLFYKIKNHFTRNKLDYYEDPYSNLLLIRSRIFVRGSQRVVGRKENQSFNFKK